MVANNQRVLLLLPMNVQSSSACSSMMSKSCNVNRLKRSAAVEARSSNRAMVLRGGTASLAGGRALLRGDEALEFVEPGVEAYSSRPAAQLTAQVIEAARAPSTTALTRNRSPSAVTSKAFR